jgi:hypothetical protein
MECAATSVFPEEKYGVRYHGCAARRKVNLGVLPKGWSQNEQDDSCQKCCKLNIKKEITELPQIIYQAISSRFTPT